jgi:hypothetical protein
MSRTLELLDDLRLSVERLQENYRILERRDSELQDINRGLYNQIAHLRAELGEFKRIMGDRDE